jgi:KTSC domain
MTPAELTSSVIQSVAYDQRTRTLTLTFHTKKVYHYAAVPLYIYQELITAKSAGQYYSRHIKGKYKAPDEAL